ncbi:hypothetical protein GJ496_006221 [Pomphorhynchus laevis]|nr:hypothetical protein GJ496_006221 [Pomphorhynchus laevis]
MVKQHKKNGPKKQRQFVIFFVTACVDYCDLQVDYDTSYCVVWTSVVPVSSRDCYSNVSFTCGFCASRYLRIYSPFLLNSLCSWKGIPRFSSNQIRLDPDNVPTNYKCRLDFDITHALSCPTCAIPTISTQNKRVERQDVHRSHILVAAKKIGIVLARSSSLALRAARSSLHNPIGDRMDETEVAAYRVN